MQKYLNIISNYHKLRSSKPDTWLTYCEDQSDISSAIKVAALALNHRNKRHSHQCRLKRVDLQLFADKLNEQSQQMLKCTNFDSLYNIVKSCSFTGIGPLTTYDTANRIGKYLKLEPEFIYVHAGTKVGVKKLLGNDQLSKMSKEQLPEPFKSSNLTPAELEDILCIYKRIL